MISHLLWALLTSLTRQLGDVCQSPDLAKAGSLVCPEVARLGFQKVHGKVKSRRPDRLGVHQVTLTKSIGNPGVQANHRSLLVDKEPLHGHWESVKLVLNLCAKSFKRVKFLSTKCTG